MPRAKTEKAEIERRRKIGKANKAYKRTEKQIKQITELGKASKGKTLQEMGHKPDCSCYMCKQSRGEPREPLSEEHKTKIKEWWKNLTPEQEEEMNQRRSKSQKREKSYRWKGGSHRYYHQQAQIIWQQKHERIKINGEIYLKEGMHILIGTRKMPVHHGDFNYKNNASWNLYLQQTRRNHLKKHQQYNRFLRFVEKLEKKELSEEEIRLYLTISSY